MKNIRLSLLILLSLLLNGLNADAQDAPDSGLCFLTAPYLQNPKTDAMTVMWIANWNCHSWVEYGKYGILSEKADMKLYGLVQANNRIQKIRLEHLKPGTKYSYKVLFRDILGFEPYKVVYGETIESGVFSFITPAILDKNVTLLIMNDIHGDSQVIPHYLSGDGYWTMQCRKLFGPLLNKYKVDVSISGHTHKYGIFEPVKGEHDFPMVIGGGPKEGTRTLTRLTIDEKALKLSMLNDSGVEIGKYEIKK